MSVLRSFRLRAFAALLLLLAAAACAPERSPDLARFYAGWARQTEDRRPVIFIPGLLGTRLRERASGRLVWGGVKGFLGGGVGDELALPVDPGELDDLVPDGPVTEVAGYAVYATILDTLQRSGGYVPGSSHPGTRAACFVFDYDWRQSCAVNAADLARKIRQVQALYGDPSLKVDLVAHSMGGLIARYYLLYGARDVRDDVVPVADFAGAEHVGTLVLMGTPNLGCAAALRACIEGRTIGLTSLSPEMLATGPSMYEILPSPSVQVLYETDASPSSLDLYDVGTWRRLGWGIYDPRLVSGIRARYIDRHRGIAPVEVDRHMGRLYQVFARLLGQAAAFHRALEAAPVPAGVKTVLMGGDCTTTTRAFLIEREGDSELTRFEPGQVRRRPEGVDLGQLFYEPGDGQITKSSLLGAFPASQASRGKAAGMLPDASAIFVCEHHAKLVGNVVFQDNLLQALLYRPLTPSEAGRLPGDAASPAPPEPRSPR